MERIKEIPGLSSREMEKRRRELLTQASKQAEWRKSYMVLVDEI